MWGAATNVFGYYIVGASVIAVTVVHLEYEVKGLWFGLLASSATQSMLMAILVRNERVPVTVASLGLTEAGPQQVALSGELTDICVHSLRQSLLIAYCRPHC
jgi:hypothetical protein